MWLARSAASLGGKLGWSRLVRRGEPAIGGGLARAESEPAKSDPVAVGYEIFNREWMPNDPRGHGGDGLGPVYNDSSCVACHNSGGSGGGGPDQQEHRHPQCVAQSSGSMAASMRS